MDFAPTGPPLLPIRCAQYYGGIPLPKRERREVFAATQFAYRFDAPLSSDGSSGPGVVSAIFVCADGGNRWRQR